MPRSAKMIAIEGNTQGLKGKPAVWKEAGWLEQLSHWMKGSHRQRCNRSGDHPTILQTQSQNPLVLWRALDFS